MDRMVVFMHQQEKKVSKLLVAEEKKNEVETNSIRKIERKEKGKETKIISVLHQENCR